MNNQAGNVSMALLIGVVGAFAAKSHWSSLTQKKHEAGHRRMMIDTDNQSLTALTIYKGLLSSNGINNFAIYPEPYLSARPNLVQHTSNLPSQYRFQSNTATVNMNLPAPSRLDNSQIQRLMTDNFNLNSICQNNGCGQSSIRVLRFNRDINGMVSERILSADVEVTTPVFDPNTNRTDVRTYLAQVPLEAPRITNATLRFFELNNNNQVVRTFDLSQNNSGANTILRNTRLRAELIVGGVALNGILTLYEGQNMEKTSVNSLAQLGVDQFHYPRHGATSIRNNGARLATLTDTVENGKTYRLRAMAQSVSGHGGDIEINLNFVVELPPPPNPWICEPRCADQGTWYYGDFINTTGSYWNMIPGKFSCMFNSTGDWNQNAAHPVYSFDPANNCQIEGPVGHRNSATGCFTGDTLIRMADGSERTISSLQVGEMVWNPVENRAFPIRSVTVGREFSEMTVIHLPDGRKIRATIDHPFVDASGRLVRASELTSLRDENQRKLRVFTRPDPNKDGITVWNIELEGSLKHSEHYVLANGVIAGDLYLQRYLHEFDQFVQASELSRRNLGRLLPSELEMR